ncbi:MAG: pyridoxamine 5'-phosphate oxidase family protein [Lachnospiraceae bacterium]|nr:pyridoxamine 5'-phosphate oxidase family protein [Lachnospiraceae bacterium]
MRRAKAEIKDYRELQEVLTKADVCRLAFNDDSGFPYILPLNYGVKCEEGKTTLYFHGAKEGRKYEVIAADNRASFEVESAHDLVMDMDKHTCTMDYESVIGRGRVYIVEDEDERMAGIRLIMAQYREADFPVDLRPMSVTRMMKLEVEAMTGKRRHAPAKG